MKPLTIIAGLRTPFCRMGSDLASLSAADLGQHACAALLTRTGIDPGELSEVILGCVAQPVDSANVARIIALRSGVPQHVPAVTVHRNCASGMESLGTAADRMAAGRGDLFLVGGTESMSNIPLLYPQATADKFTSLSRARSLGQKLAAIAAFRPSDFKPRIGLQLGLTDPYSGMIMGDTAELLAREYELSRREQDAFAARSQARALAAREALKGEIAPLHLDGRVIEVDNGIREDSTEEKLAKLRPIFDRKTGTVTAGNSSQVTDGAVALLVGSEEAAERLGIEPLGRLLAHSVVGCDPARMGLGPVHAIHQLRKAHDLHPDDADVIEINEAFAAQVLAVLRELAKPGDADRPAISIDEAKLNRRGGSIALGHPVGASGARLVLTALDQLREIKGRRALVSLCVGGGQGTALWLEAP
ncbi:MAG: thiolase family protein [Akkermansiaceae bacterium]|nr:thiolase family protein [Akkermansiaceae bacterium]